MKLLIVYEKKDRFVVLYEEDMYTPMTEYGAIHFMAKFTNKTSLQ